MPARLGDQAADREDDRQAEDDGRGELRDDLALDEAEAAEGDGEPTTRTASATRPRSHAPMTLSSVSDTANAARLATTIRHVSARSPKC